MPRLHIIEPTLINASGHCFGLAKLMAATKPAEVTELHLWAGNSIDAGLFEDSDIKVHGHFSRRLRRLQAFWLMRKLLKAGETVFVPTTSRAELMLYSLLPSSTKAKGKAFFYLHQMRLNEKKRQRLAKIAAYSPMARILCTHPGIADEMRAAGFHHVRVQPYPFSISGSEEGAPFSQLVFPGMARMDKGLDLISDLVGLLNKRNSRYPIQIQAAPNHHGEYPAGVQHCLEQIKASDYPHLRLLSAPLDAEAYQTQFKGGICLQPYDVAAYANKISSVTLDALSMGCPVIASAGTWSSELIEEFDVGISIDSGDADAWLVAIEKVVEHYPRYQKKCQLACETLGERHHPKHLWKMLSKED